MNVAKLLLQGGQHGGQHLAQGGGQNLLGQAGDVGLQPRQPVSRPDTQVEQLAAVKQGGWLGGSTWRGAQVCREDLMD